MDINDIEKDLNQFPASEQQILQGILNVSIKNQAILESVLSLQMEIVTKRDHNDPLITKVNDQILKRISEIQAGIVSNFNQDDL